MITVQAPAPFQNFQTRGASYTANGAGLINNVALNDVKELVSDGCVVVQNGLIQSSPMSRILRASSRALANNPEDAALSTATQSISTTHNATYVKSLFGLTTPGLYTFSGGCATPTTASKTHVALPVSSVAPATGGNIASYFSDGTNQSNNAWGWAADWVTDAPSFEIQVQGAATATFRIAVDGQYINKSWTALGASGNGIVYITVTPPASNGSLSRQNRHITFECNGAPVFFGASVAFVDSVLAWVDPDKLRVAVTGDSYSEGQGSPTPGNSSWAKVLGRLMGWADVRQVAVGSTGYLNNAGGTRSTIVQQIPNWLGVNSDLPTFDAVVFAGGYNDAENYTPNQIQSAVLAALTAARATLPSAVFFVFGTFSGKRGPDAASIACEAAIQAAVTAFSDPLTYFIPVTTDSIPWFNGTGYQSATNGSGNSDYYVYSDAVHPNETGHSYLARLGAKAIRNVLSSLPY